MTNYKEDYLKNRIMGDNRHQFIYGYNNENRKNFLKQVLDEFPVMVDSNSPIVVYLDDFGLPKKNIIDKKLDIGMIDTLSNEYLAFSIAYAILLKTKKDVDMALLNLRFERLFDFYNKYCANFNNNIVHSFDELIGTILMSKEFYLSYYVDYIEKGAVVDKSINDLAIPFLHLETFVSKYKRILNNNSYFGIVLDKCYDICMSSTKSVNLLMGSRINSDISMKIVVEPGKWDSNVDVNGRYVEYVHDYDIVELDDSQSEYVRKLKKSNFNY